MLHLVMDVHSKNCVTSDFVTMWIPWQPPDKTKRDGKHGMQEAATGVTWYCEYRQTFFVYVNVKQSKVMTKDVV